MIEMNQRMTSQEVPQTNSDELSAISSEPKEDFKITLQTNYVSEHVFCGICGDPYITGPFDFFTEDTSSPVCMECAAKFAPHLRQVQEAALGFAGVKLYENLPGFLAKIKGSLDIIHNFVLSAKEQIATQEPDSVGNHLLGVIVSMFGTLLNSIHRSIQDATENAFDLARAPFQYSINHEVIRSLRNGGRGRRMPKGATKTAMKRLIEGQAGARLFSQCQGKIRNQT